MGQRKAGIALHCRQLTCFWPRCGIDTLTHKAGMAMESFDTDGRQHAAQRSEMVLWRGVADPDGSRDGAQRQTRQALGFQQVNPRQHQRVFQITVVVRFCGFGHFGRFHISSVNIFAGQRKGIAALIFTVEIYTGEFHDP